MDPLESLRERSVAVTEAAEQMALSYGEVWYEREALRKRVAELERQLALAAIAYPDFEETIAEYQSLTVNLPEAV